MKKEEMLVDYEKMKETRPVRHGQCIPNKRAPLTTSEGAAHKVCASTSTKRSSSPKAGGVRKGMTNGGMQIVRYK
eukprot:14298307-Heterocapsa_arctica.AAC.1